MLERWPALNHAIAVNRLLGYEDRVAMTNRKEHGPSAADRNEHVYQFFEWWLKRPGLSEGHDRTTTSHVSGTVFHFTIAPIDKNNGRAAALAGTLRMQGRRTLFRSHAWELNRWAPRLDDMRFWIVSCAKGRPEAFAELCAGTRRWCARRARGHWATRPMPTTRFRSSSWSSSAGPARSASRELLGPWLYAVAN